MTDKLKRKRKGERADKRIVRTLTVGHLPDGSPDRKYFYGLTVTEAVDKRDEYERLMKTGHIKVLDKHTVKQWVEEYHATYGKNPDYKYYTDRLIADLGSVRINEVRAVDLQRSLNKFKGKSTSGATKYKMILKQIFYRAFRNKIILDDPSLDLIPPEGTTEGSHRALTQWEVKLIVNNWSRHKNGLWFLILLCTGLRRGELVALTWDKVDLPKAAMLVNSAGSFLYSNSPKIKDSTKSLAGDRILPVPSMLIKALEAVPPEIRTGYICTTTGRPISETIVRRNLTSFCRVLEQIHNGHPVDPNRQYKTKDRMILEHNSDPNKPFEPFGFRIHDLRHTYATTLYDAGVDIKTAQYLLGHSDIKTTLKLYTHLSKSRKAAAFSDLNTHFDNIENGSGESLFQTQISATSGQKVVNINDIVNNYLILDSESAIISV